MRADIRMTSTNEQTNGRLDGHFHPKMSVMTILVKEDKLLEEVIEEQIKEDGCFALWVTSSHYWFGLLLSFYS